MVLTNGTFCFDFGAKKYSVTVSEDVSHILIAELRKIRFAPLQFFSHFSHRAKSKKVTISGYKDIFLPPIRMVSYISSNYQLQLFCCFMWDFSAKIWRGNAFRAFDKMMKRNALFSE